MRKRWGNTRNIPAAQRGQIIQRILIDGWTPGQAAAALGVEERRVVRWVTAYRRQGMASLRGDLGADRMARRWIAWVQSRVLRALATARGRRGSAELASCVVLRRTGDGRRPR
jgi:transposase